MLCEKYGIHPNIFYRWENQFLRVALPYNRKFVSANGRDSTLFRPELVSGCHNVKFSLNQDRINHKKS